MYFVTKHIQTELSKGSFEYNLPFKRAIVYESWV